MNERKSFKQRIDNFFSISKNNSSFKVEIIAGIATFLAMAYILIVNPDQILNRGTNDPRWSSLFIATAFGAIIGTLLMSLYAKMPYAQASGMGLNSTLGAVIGGGVGSFSYNYSYSLPNALLLVFISGVIFLILSIVPIGKDSSGKLITLREKIFDGMPEPIRKAIPVGIGLFIAFIGMQNADIIQSNPYTLVQFVDFKPMFKGQVFGDDGTLLPYVTSLVAFIGLIAICVLAHFKVKGAVIFGILIATIVYSLFDLNNFKTLLGENDVTWKFWENFSNYFSFSDEKGGVFFTAFTEGFNMPEGSFFTSLMLVITFCMIDMFDTMGTVVGCATNAGLIDENGKPLNYNKTMISDSVATCAGAMLGTSTVTTFVESGTGIAAGGKTGLTSLTTAVLFLLSIFLLPVFAFIPSAAAASALMYVGILMIQNVKNIDFSSIKNAAPAFLTIIMMLLTYSITSGIGIGIISYVLINLVCFIVDAIKYGINKEKNQKPKWNISIVSIVVSLLFFVYFCVPTSF